MSTLCEVCGKTFRTLKLNHLRTHGIVSWDQYEEVVAKTKRPDQNLIREVAHRLLHRQEIPEEHSRKLAEINAGRRLSMPGVLSATDMRRVLRLTKLMERLERIDGVLLDDEQLAQCTFKDLLELAKFASADIETIIKQLSGDAKKAGFQAAVENLYNYNIVNSQGVVTQFDSRLPHDPRAQASLMQQVESFLGKFRNGEVPELPAKSGPPVKPSSSDGEVIYVESSETK